jgi:hypothetical protein
MKAELPTRPELLFRPDAFFLKPWNGWGVVRDIRGRTVERFECHGQAETGSRSATSTITYLYETGRVEKLVWDIVSDDEDHYFATELRGGVEGQGRPSGRDFRWTFMVPMPGKFGKLFKLSAVAVYTLLAPTTAMGVTRFRLFGVTVRTMTAFFQHRADEAA